MKPPNRAAVAQKIIEEDANKPKYNRPLDSDQNQGGMP